MMAAREERKKEKGGGRRLLRTGRRGGRERGGRVRRKDVERHEGGNSEDDCSANNPRCKRPTGKQVHWVQCDGCQLWFHLYCIGLKPAQISEEEDFMCKACKVKKVKDDALFFS